MAADNAILILICMYVGAIYGGSRSAILLDIPARPRTPRPRSMASRSPGSGEAGRAMGIAACGSFLGTLIGVLALASSPRSWPFALEFGAFEFFWLAVFGS